MIFDRREFTVRNIPLGHAQAMVERYHYARGGSNTGTYTHGLFRRERPAELLGIAWWIPPTKSAAQATWDGDWQKVLSLSRLVLIPGLPTNAASFLIAQSIKAIQRDGVWTFAKHKFRMILRPSRARKAQQNLFFVDNPPSIV